MHANTAFYLGFGLFLMVSYKCNCRICPKQQLGEINSDLPPWANDWNPAARAQEAAAAVTLTAGVTLASRPACFLRCLLQFRFTLIYISVDILLKNMQLSLIIITQLPQKVQNKYCSGFLDEKFKQKFMVLEEYC